MLSNFSLSLSTSFLLKADLLSQLQFYILAIGLCVILGKIGNEGAGRGVALVMAVGVGEMLGLGVGLGQGVVVGVRIGCVGGVLWRMAFRGVFYWNREEEIANQFQGYHHDVRLQLRTSRLTRIIRGCLEQR
jgi:hypothetical protein